MIHSACLRSFPAGQAYFSIRSGRVHGHTTSNHTGFPRWAAASTRMGTSGRPGQVPSHAARASAKKGGTHFGSTARRAPASSRASASRGDQSGAVGAFASAPPSSCTGTW